MVVWSVAMATPVTTPSGTSHSKSCARSRAGLVQIAAWSWRKFLGKLRSVAASRSCVCGFGASGSAAVDSMLLDDCAASATLRQKITAQQASVRKKLGSINFVYILDFQTGSPEGDFSLLPNPKRFLKGKIDSNRIVISERHWSTVI